MELLGRLIGLARAVEGNEDKITEDTAKLFSEALTSPGADILDRIEAEKRRIVPDCFVCESPCGRTDDYDTGRLSEESADIRSVKAVLVLLLKGICVSGTPDSETLCWICDALQLIGIEGLDAPYLMDAVREAGKLYGERAFPC